MSYDISLGEPPVRVSRFTEGGTYVIGGSDYATLNVTYNYSNHFRDYFEGGIWDINGIRASKVIPLLAKAVEALGTERDDDYWKSTEGNAGYALSILLLWARQHPRAKFHVS